MSLVSRVMTLFSRRISDAGWEKLEHVVDVSKSTIIWIIQAIISVFSGLVNSMCRTSQFSTLLLIKLLSELELFTTLRLGIQFESPTLAIVLGPKTSVK